MNGNSKLLALVAIGVIGLGSAMPYWSAEPTESEEARQVSAPETDGSTTTVGRPPLAATAERDGEVDRNPASGHEPRPVTLEPSRSMAYSGLDERINLPTLSAGMDNPVSSFQATYESQSAGSPSGVTLATRVQQLEQRSEVVPSMSIPIEIGAPSDAEDSRYGGKADSPRPITPQRQEAADRPAAPRSLFPQSSSRTESRNQSEIRHKIVDGDSLESLAQRYLENAELAGVLFEANREVLSDPELLPIGQILVIPPPDELSQREEKIEERPTTSVRPLMAPPSAGQEHPWTNLKPIKEPTGKAVW